MRKLEAKGTKASLVYAFSLQINPEVPSLESNTILDYLKAFLLLYNWSFKESKIDLARRMAPFINEFSAAYVNLVLHPDYRPDMPRLIDDYLDENPTRNRPLDMLPLFRHLDDARVASRKVEWGLIKPRPAFHYRLPDCMIDEPNWRVAREWNFWAEIEDLVGDPDKIEPMAAEVVRKERTFIYSLVRIFLYPLVYFLRKMLSAKSTVLADEGRDALEYRFLEKAIQKNIPVLGICRGAQLINVYAGGSLFQELSRFYVETPQYATVFPKKNVRVAPDARLARILKTRRLKVNALHRQAINKKGNDIRIAATESNGVVQAVEHAKRPFVIGVQWHPEYLPQHRLHQRIFRALVRACQ